MGEGRWVLALADRLSGERLAEQLALPGKVCGAHTAREALSLVSRLEPDYLAADPILPGMDAAALFEAVRALPLNTLPWGICLCPKGAQALARRAMEAGACLVADKPVDGPSLLEKIKDLGPMDRLPRKKGALNQIEHRLWALGFSPGMKGTRALALAIALCSRDLALAHQLTARVYPLVARHMGAEADQVQHAIRRSVEAAWASGPREMQYALFGNTIDAKRGKPTGGEMIARMAELLRTGMEIET